MQTDDKLPCTAWLNCAQPVQRKKTPCSLLVLWEFRRTKWVAIWMHRKDKTIQWNPHV